MGETVHRLNRTLPDWIDYEPAEENLMKTLDLLLTKGIPWLEQFGSAEGIIDFILKDQYSEYRRFGFHAFDSFFQKQYLAFSLLYIDRISEGLKTLEALPLEISESADESMQEYKRQLVNIIRTLKEAPGMTEAMLQGFVADNKKDLKIDYS
jgi:hypothetical protein